MYTYALPSVSSTSFASQARTDEFYADVAHTVQLRASVEQLLQRDAPSEPLQVVQVRPSHPISCVLAPATNSGGTRS